MGCTIGKGLGIGARAEFQLRFLQHNNVTPPHSGHTSAYRKHKKENTKTLFCGTIESSCGMESSDNTHCGGQSSPREETASISCRVAIHRLPPHPRKFFPVSVNFPKLPEIFSQLSWLANWNSLVSSQAELKLERIWLFWVVLQIVQSCSTHTKFSGHQRLLETAKFV